MSRQIFPLRLRQGDGAKFRAMIVRRSDRVATRAKILLKRAAGETQRQVARELGVARSTVVFAETTYRQRGLDGVFDKPRPGRPRLDKRNQMKNYAARAMKNLLPRSEILDHLTGLCGKIVEDKQGQQNRKDALQGRNIFDTVVSKLRASAGIQNDVEQLARIAGLPKDYRGVQIFSASSFQPIRKCRENGLRIVHADGHRLSRRSSGNGKIYWCTPDRQISIGEHQILRVLRRALGRAADKLWTEAIDHISLHELPIDHRMRVDRFRQFTRRGLQEAKREKGVTERELIILPKGADAMVKLALQRRLELVEQRIQDFQSLEEQIVLNQERRLKGKEDQELMRLGEMDVWIMVVFAWNERRVDHMQLRQALLKKIESERNKWLQEHSVSDVFCQNGLSSNVDRICLPIKSRSQRHKE
jgi:hypothetical protein